MPSHADYLQEVHPNNHTRHSLPTEDMPSLITYQHSSAKFGCIACYPYAVSNASRALQTVLNLPPFYSHPFGTFGDNNSHETYSALTHDCPAPAQVPAQGVPLIRADYLPQQAYIPSSLGFETMIQHHQSHSDAVGVYPKTLPTPSDDIPRPLFPPPSTSSNFTTSQPGYSEALKDGPDSVFGNEEEGCEPGLTEADGNEADGNEADSNEAGQAEANGTEANDNGSDDNGSDGSQPDGSQPDGSQSDGSESDGSESDGSESDGSESDGSETDQAEAGDSEAHDIPNSNAQRDALPSSSVVHDIHSRDETEPPCRQGPPVLREAISSPPNTHNSPPAPTTPINRATASIIGEEERPKKRKRSSSDDSSHSFRPAFFETRFRFTGLVADSLETGLESWLIWSGAGTWIDGPPVTRLEGTEVNQNYILKTLVGSLDNDVELELQRGPETWQGYNEYGELVAIAKHSDVVESLNKSLGAVDCRSKLVSSISW